MIAIYRSSLKYCEMYDYCRANVSNSIIKYCTFYWNLPLCLENLNFGFTKWLRNLLFNRDLVEVLFTFFTYTEVIGDFVKYMPIAPGEQTITGFSNKNLETHIGFIFPFLNQY